MRQSKYKYQKTPLTIQKSQKNKINYKKNIKSNKLLYKNQKKLI